MVALKHISYIVHLQTLEISHFHLGMQNRWKSFKMIKGFKTHPTLKPVWNIFVEPPWSIFLLTKCNILLRHTVFFPYWAYIILFTTTYSTVYENQTEVYIDIELQKATNPRGFNSTVLCVENDLTLEVNVHICYLCWKYEHLYCQENMEVLRNKSMNHPIKVHIGKYIHQQKSQVFNIDMVE